MTNYEKKELHAADYSTRKESGRTRVLKAGHKYRSTSIHTKSRRRERGNSFSLLVGGWRHIREMVLHRNNVGRDVAILLLRFFALLFQFPRTSLARATATRPAT